MSNIMILSGLCVIKSKSLKAAGFADITGVYKWKKGENELWLPGSCSSSNKKPFHTLSYTFR